MCHRSQLVEDMLLPEVRLRLMTWNDLILWLFFGKYIRNVPTERWVYTVHTCLCASLHLRVLLTPPLIITPCMNWMQISLKRSMDLVAKMKNQLDILLELRLCLDDFHSSPPKHNIDYFYIHTFTILFTARIIFQSILVSRGSSHQSSPICISRKFSKGLFCNFLEKLMSTFDSLFDWELVFFSWQMNMEMIHMHSMKEQRSYEFVWAMKGEKVIALMWHE